MILSHIFYRGHFYRGTQVGGNYKHEPNNRETMKATKGSLAIKKNYCI